MNELSFDAEKHIYTKNGHVLPSVTQIIKPIIEYSSAIPESTMEYARQRGQAVHRACEIIDLGEEFAEPLDEVIVPYVEAWKKFVAEKKVKVISTEQRLAHKTMCYAGTLDVDVMIDDEEWVLDRKAIAQLHPAIGVQLAGYEGLLGRKVKRAAVQLKSDGTYMFQEYKNKTDWPVFVALLTVHNWKENHGSHHP